MTIPRSASSKESTKYFPETKTPHESISPITKKIARDYLKAVSSATGNNRLLKQTSLRQIQLLRFIQLFDVRLFIRERGRHTPELVERRFRVEPSSVVILMNYHRHPALLVDRFYDIIRQGRDDRTAPSGLHLHL